MDWLNAIVQGVLLGGLYALFGGLIVFLLTGAMLFG